MAKKSKSKKRPGRKAKAKKTVAKKSAAKKTKRPVKAKAKTKRLRRQYGRAKKAKPKSQSLREEGRQESRAAPEAAPKRRGAAPSSPAPTDRRPQRRRRALRRRSSPSTRTDDVLSSHGGQARISPWRGRAPSLSGNIRLARVLASTCRCSSSTPLNTLRRSRVGLKIAAVQQRAFRQPGQSAITRPPRTAPPTRKAQPPVP